MSWAALEFSLALILAELIEADHATVLIMSAALDYRHRRDIITSLAAIKLYDDKEMLRDLTSYMASVKGMAKERNEAVHSMWMADPSDIKRTMRIVVRNQGHLSMKFKRIAPGHLKSVADKISLLANQGKELSFRLRAPVKTWSEKQQPTFPPHLDKEAHRQESI